MRIFFLWTLYIIAGVTALRLIPFGIFEFHMPAIGKPQSVVHGGTMAKQGEYPFMIFIYIKSLGTCSASLVKPDWVLTAAHCFHSSVDPGNVFLVGGQTDMHDYIKERKNINLKDSVNETSLKLEERRAEVIHLHPDFLLTDEKILHDIALIKLKKPFTNTTLIKTIPLSFDKIYKKKVCSILGWGLNSFDEGKMLNVVGKKKISTTSLGCKYNLSHPAICLESDTSGICEGDSGSPLVCDGKVKGVASFYYSKSKRCFDSLENYYTDLFGEKQWIESVINIGSRKVEITVFRIFMFIFTNLWIWNNIFN